MLTSIIPAMMVKYKKDILFILTKSKNVKLIDNLYAQIVLTTLSELVPTYEISGGIGQWSVYYTES